MTKVVWIAAVLVVLAGDWAALHDILHGTEPDYTQEWTWLVVSTLALGLAAWITLRRRRKEAGAS